MVRLSEKVVFAFLLWSQLITKQLNIRRLTKLRNKFVCLHVKQWIMNTKLTLNLDKDIIEQAKSYAKDNRVSLSKLIENYLNSLTSKIEKERKVSPLVESLTGVIPTNLIDDKKDYRDFIAEKYS
jgi:hypothetical protein